MSREKLEEAVKEEIPKYKSWKNTALTAGTALLTYLGMACGGGNGNMPTPPEEPPQNQKPTVSLQADPTQGVRPLDVNVSVDGSDPDGNITEYRLSTDQNTNDYEITTTNPIDTTLTFQDTTKLKAQTKDNQEKNSNTETKLIQPTKAITYTLTPDSIAEGDTATHKVNATDNTKIDSIFLDTNGNGNYNIRIKGNTIDTTLTYEEPGDIQTAAKAQDNQGKSTPPTTQTLQITDTPELTVNVKGASPQPDVGLVDIVNALVIAQKNGEADSTRTNTNGQATIPNLENGEYTLIVRDETNPDTIGTWYDIANPNNPHTIQINEDTNHTVGLYAHIPLHPEDTAYQNNLDWFDKITRNLGNILEREPKDGSLPLNFWIHPDSATQEQIQTMQDAIKKWNGPNNEYNYAKIVQDSTKRDYIIILTDSIGAETNTKEGTIKINHRWTGENLNDLTNHELTHTYLNEAEDRTEQDIYCSQPGPACPPGKPTNLELNNFTSSVILKRTFGSNHRMDEYTNN